MINEARFPWLGFFGRDIPEKSDSVSEKLISISSGELMTVRISSIVKGKNGMPGEIKGSIANRKNNRKCWIKYRIWYIWEFN